jgi:hypothetical protein
LERDVGDIGYRVIDNTHDRKSSIVERLIKAGTPIEQRSRALPPDQTNPLLFSALALAVALTIEAASNEGARSDLPVAFGNSDAGASRVTCSARAPSRTRTANVPTGDAKTRNRTRAEDVDPEGSRALKPEPDALGGMNADTVRTPARADREPWPRIGAVP